MPLEVSEAEKKRRVLIVMLQKSGFLPPPLPRERLYAYGTMPDLPFVTRPGADQTRLRSSLRSDAVFRSLARRTLLSPAR
jgi:hypothetical protein